MDTFSNNRTMMAVVSTAPTAEALTSLRLRIGELVTVTLDYEAPGNWGSSILKPGDVGVIMADDGSSNPFR